MLVVRRSKIWLFMNFLKSLFSERHSIFQLRATGGTVLNLGFVTRYRTSDNLQEQLEKKTDFLILGMSLYIHRPIGDSSHLLPHALHDFNLVTILSRQILFPRHCKRSESSSKEADFSFSDSMNYE